MSDLQPDPQAPTATTSVDHVLGAEACEQNARKALLSSETAGDTSNALIYVAQSQTWATLALGHRAAVLADRLAEIEDAVETVAEGV